MDKNKITELTTELSNILNDLKLLDDTRMKCGAQRCLNDWKLYGIDPSETYLEAMESDLKYFKEYAPSFFARNQKAASRVPEMMQIADKLITHISNK